MKEVSRAEKEYIIEGCSLGLRYDGRSKNLSFSVSLSSYLINSGSLQVQMIFEQSQLKIAYYLTLMVLQELS